MFVCLNTIIRKGLLYWRNDLNTVEAAGALNTTLETMHVKVNTLLLK